MREIKWISLLCVAILCIPFIVDAQSKKIDSSTFYKALRDGEDASDKVSHRRTIVEDRYENGKVVNSATSLSERIPPDKSRSVHSYYLGRGLEQSTVVQIGSLYYCRQGVRPWKKSNQYCGQMTISGEPSDSIVDYNTDVVDLNGAQVRLYSSAGSYHGAEGILRSFEDKIWINERGLIIRRESTTASEERGVKYGSKTTTTFEYNPIGLKIQAPI